MIYESCVGQLNLKQLQCKDLVELSCCRTVVCPSSVLCRGWWCWGEVTVLLAGEMGCSDISDGHTATLHVLGEVKNNILPGDGGQ